MGNAQTRDCIDRALIDIIAEKDLARISAVELIARANVSRTTFYRYYESVPQMAEEIADRFFEGIRAASGLFVVSKVDTKSVEVPVPGFVMVLKYIYDHSDTFIVFTGPHGDAGFTARFVDMVREFYGGKLAYEGHVREDYDMRLEFILAGCPGMLRYWLNERSDLEPAAVASILQRLIFAPYILEEHDKLERRAR